MRDWFSYTMMALLVVFIGVMIFDTYIEGVRLDKQLEALAYNRELTIELIDTYAKMIRE